MQQVIDFINIMPVVGKTMAGIFVLSFFIMIMIMIYMEDRGRRWKKDAMLFSKEIERILNGNTDDWHVINYPTLVDGIHHIIVTARGVFVIRVQYADGHVRGGKDSRWTVSNRLWTEEIINPSMVLRKVIENRLAPAMKCPTDIFIPIAVFPDKVEIDVAADVSVIHAGSLRDFILSPVPDIMTPGRIEGFVHTFEILQHAHDFMKRRDEMFNSKDLQQ